MSDNSIEYMDTHYEECAEQAYQDYMEYSFYEFLYGIRTDCMAPRAYNPPNDLRSIHRFWEVD